MPSHPEAEKFWFASQYILGSSSRAGRSANGIWVRNFDRTLGKFDHILGIFCDSLAYLTEIFDSAILLRPLRKALGVSIVEEDGDWSRVAGSVTKDDWESTELERDFTMVDW